MRKGVSTGEFVRCRDFASPPSPGPARDRLDASFVRQLLVDETAIIHSRGLMLEGFHISGVLSLTGCTVDRRLIFRSCSFDQPLRLNDATISGLWLEGVNAVGLAGIRLTVKGSVVVRRGGISKLAVDLTEASIANSLLCHGVELWAGELHDDDDELGGGLAALTLEGARIGGSCRIADGAKLYGGVDMYGCTIDGNLEIVDASLYGRKPRKSADPPEQERFHYALDATAARIRGRVIVLGGAHVEGLRGYGADFGDLEIVEATVSPRDSCLANALDLRLCRVRDAILVGDNSYLGGRADLSQAHASMFHLDATRWPKGGTLLDGFTYDRFATSGRSWENDTVEWLDRDPNALGLVFHPQPWEQAATVLSAMGHETEAQRVRINKARRSARAERKALLDRCGGPRKWLDWARNRNVANLAQAPWYAVSWLRLRAWHFFFDLTTAYGHQPLRSVALLVGLILGGAYAFARCEPLMVAAADHPPPFDPLVFAIDKALPILGFGLADAWQPTAAAEWLWRALYAYQALGWILGGFAVAGFTGLIRK